MEAIDIAEYFIAQNGYTNAPPMADKSNLKLESLEYSSDPDEILAHRHNTLESKAYEVIRHRDNTGWTIVFRFSGTNEMYNRLAGANEARYKDGRAVVMDQYGREVHVEHQDIILGHGQRVDQ
jgi:hypothetical protein